MAKGSSPLARGLRGDSQNCRENRGIIPARAGFTVRRRGYPDRSRDHPRSRGVYKSIIVNVVYVTGSSPLARGLRRRTRPDPLSQPDHPRSRGVYHSPTPPFPTRRGSSPLARGLQIETMGHSHQFGIIPARAGFTGHVCERGRSARDHPRSRGVYRLSSIIHHHLSGSSPLARGLLVGLGAVPFLSRIIPARAGFTIILEEEGGDEGDHPRSRGVYNTREGG